MVIHDRQYNPTIPSDNTRRPLQDDDTCQHTHGDPQLENIVDIVDIDDFDDFGDLGNRRQYTTTIQDTRTGRRRFMATIHTGDRPLENIVVFLVFLVFVVFDDFGDLGTDTTAAITSRMQSGALDSSIQLGLTCVTSVANG